eukprot:9785772-Ditylum_brightwellii.AAC.1
MGCSQSTETYDITNDIKASTQTALSEQLEKITRSMSSYSSSDESSCCGTVQSNDSTPVWERDERKEIARTPIRYE